MQKRIVDIRTRDGVCPTRTFHPDGEGPWPGIVVYMDGPGIRPSLEAIAERIASRGYFVILPDLFYRVGGADPEGQKRIFVDPEARRAWIARYLPIANLANVRSDTDAFLDFLASEPRVLQPKVGATGYCMGGGHALTAAGAHPDRVVAAASFHGGGLATDAPDSPHRLASSMRARLYIAAASNDPLFPEDMKQRLDASLREANCDYVLETIPGALHGWVPSDTPVHHPEMAERHFESLARLFDEALRPGQPSPPP